MEDWLFRLIVSGIIFVGSIGLGYLLSYLMKFLEHLTKHTKTNLDDYLIEALKAPVRLGTIILGTYLALYFFDPALKIFGIEVETIFGVLLIAFFCFVVAKVARGLLNWYSTEIAVKTESTIDDRVIEFLKKSLDILIYAIGLMIILEQIGVKIGPLIASLGIAGLAVALALQDTLSNLFAGFYILADKPVKVGDYIKTEHGEEGTVRDIGWRSSRIELSSGNIVIMPNTKVSQSILTNYALPNPGSSVSLKYSVDLNSDPENVEKVLIEAVKAVAKENKAIDKKQEPLVRFYEVGDYSLNFRLIYFVNNYLDQYLANHQINKEVLKRFRKAKIDFALPTRYVLNKNA